MPACSQKEGASGLVIEAEMQKLAKAKGGKCLSPAYFNSKVKLLWQCSCGHQWLATPFSIKVRNSWCPQCAGNQPLGMEAMHKLAKGKEGICLSTGYVNCKTKMLWQCKNGHEFKLTPDNIKQGRWCPYCHISGFNS
ncbi:zinc-ribbon domain-containing protein [Prolixibacter denitrificans]|nr:zinc-ribbon domain-containing protein [Prolixibacter denitrificans]